MSGPESDAEDTIVVDTSPIQASKATPTKSTPKKPTPKKQGKGTTTVKNAQIKPVILTNASAATPSKEKLGQLLGKRRFDDAFNDEETNKSAATPPKKRRKGPTAIKDTPIKPDILNDEYAKNNIKAESSPIPPSKATPTKPTPEKQGKDPAIIENTQTNPNIPTDGSEATPPKRKPGRPRKIRPPGEAPPPPPPPKEKKAPKQEPYGYYGPPGYLTNPNRTDVFADPSRVKVEEDGTVRPLSGIPGFKSVERKLGETQIPGQSVFREAYSGQVENRSLSSGSGIGRGDVDEPPPSPPLKPDPHRYLPVNPPAYGGADPRRYRHEPPRTPTPPRTMYPWPEHNVDRGTDSPGIAELPVKYDPIHALNGVRMPKSDPAPKESTDEQEIGSAGEYDEFAPLPNTMRGNTISHERTAATAEADRGAQTADKEGRAGWVPWEKM